MGWLGDGGRLGLDQSSFVGGWSATLTLPDYGRVARWPSGVVLRISRGFCYRHLDKSHPADPKPYKGDGWLNKVLTEYQQRFKIDFTKGPVSFEPIQELVLARNAGIHRDKGNLDRYLARIKAPAFTDENDQFFVTRDALVAIIQDCEEFLKWVIAQIEELHAVAAAKAAKK